MSKTFSFGWRLTLLLVLTLLSIPAFTAKTATPHWAIEAMIDPQSQVTPLLPFMDYYIDETMSLDIDEATAPARAAAYQPLSLEKLPRVEGITWLRFTIAPLGPEQKAGTFLLDMGQSVPGEPILYDPERNELSGATEWRENYPTQRNILLLPESGPDAITCYLRLDGLPGPWFYPMIRTPQNAASNWGSLARTGAILALGVVMVLCLLRGLSENGQWRIWTALFVGTALAQALLGMPAIGIKTDLTSLAAILTPGIALMLLPHVGRHLLRSKGVSTVIDIQLLLLSLPGAALALLPLIPGWNWLERWLDLWPGLTLIFVPTALGAWIAGLGGAKRFLLACLLPPIFVAVSIGGLEFGLPPNLLSSLPLWGVALSALLLATTRSPAHMIAADENREPAPAPQNTDIITLGHPLDDPNLRLLPPESETPAVESSKDSEINGATPKLAADVETALRVAADDIQRQGMALGECSLPPAARNYAEQMIAQARRMNEILFGDRTAASSPTETQPVKFDLQHILREAHDAVAVAAENSNVSLSWHMPPHLGQLYLGKAVQLKETLHDLLESAVRASSHGAVRLTARRVPDSSDPGYLVFTVTDNGGGYPPNERSGVAVARAWELAGQNDGYLGVESSVKGTSIAFSMHLHPLEEDGDEQKDPRPHVILACDDPKLARTLAAIMGEVPCRLSQVANAHEALVSQSLDPAPLLVATGKLAMPAAADMAHEFARLAGQAGFVNCHVLALTKDDSQWKLLKPSGFTHAMLEPVEPDVFMRTVRDLCRMENNGSHEKEAKTGKGKVRQDDKINISQDASIKSDDPRKDNDDEIASHNSWPGFSRHSSPQETLLPKKDGETSSDEPLTMLVEQQFPLPDSFEGPEWLEDASQEKDDLQKVGTKGKTAMDSGVSTVAAPHDGKHEVGKGFDNDAATIITSMNTAGVSAVKNMPVAGGNFSGDAANFEWVGEPQAVEKKDTVSDTPITDFIVGVERSGQASDKKNAGKLSEKTAAEGLLASSVSLVGSTFSQTIVNGGAPTSGKAEESIDPVIANLVNGLDAAINAARDAAQHDDCPGVAEAAGQIALLSENYGLRNLGRMAQCIQRAAGQNDLNSLKDLLPELVLAVERNRIALLPGK